MRISSNNDTEEFYAQCMWTVRAYEGQGPLSSLVTSVITPGQRAKGLKCYISKLVVTRGRFKSPGSRKLIGEPCVIYVLDRETGCFLFFWRGYKSTCFPNLPSLFGDDHLCLEFVELGPQRVVVEQRLRLPVYLESR